MAKDPLKSNQAATNFYHQDPLIISSEIGENVKFHVNLSNIFCNPAANNQTNQLIYKETG